MCHFTKTYSISDAESKMEEYSKELHVMYEMHIILKI